LVIATGSKDAVVVFSADNDIISIRAGDDEIGVGEIFHREVVEIAFVNALVIIAICPF
jgi:hypothetical protein